MDQEPSILIPNGYSKSSCGYCKSNQDTSATIGFVSKRVQVSDYQALVDRGWRRSGEYYYKPDVRNSCCPQYTIRLDASLFKPRKDQRKAVNRWNRYILGHEYARKAAILCPKSRQEKQQLRNRPNLPQKVHEVEYGKLPRPYEKKMKARIAPVHKFEVELEPDDYTEEKFALWQNYQQHVHLETPSRSTRTGFKRFLCSGIGQSRPDGGQYQKLGSYHQCYRVDGKLVAMGVLDLLPHCVSSVYLMYHDEFKDWEFGKLSALREITLAKEGGYSYLYMGFYVRACVKMEYKANFKPTLLLDPISYEWSPLDEDLKERLLSRKFVSMHLERLFNMPSGSHDLEKWLEDPLQTQKAEQSIEAGNVRYERALTYFKGTSQDPDHESGTQSAFQAGMPGILPVADLEKAIDIGKWRLRLQNVLVRLEDLRGWAEYDVTKPGNLKSVTAELAASIGVDLVEKTTISFSV